MGEALPKKKKKEDGCFISLIKGIGCFFFLLILFNILVIGAGYYFFSPILKSVSTDAVLPEFEGPTDHDFWSLQEKNIKELIATQQDISLTNGEYNALLSSIRIPPVSGVYLHRVRHYYKDKELRYFLICSGYTIRKLYISFVVGKNEKGFFPSEIKINNWKVPGDSFYEKFTKKIINDLANTDKSGLLTKIITGSLNPKFESN